MKFPYLLTLLASVVLSAVVLPAAQAKPNVIFILVDDLGYGDVGCFHQNARDFATNRNKPAFATPNLDAMASEGAMMTQHYSPAPVCAPSRASLLAGVHQGHCNIRDNQFDRALADNHTLGSVMRGAGYSTAAIGKWGIQGGQEKGGSPTISSAFPTKRGFDFFFGYLDHSAGHRHYPKENPVDSGDPDGLNRVWENDADVTSQLDKCYSTDLFTARAKKWIADQRASTPEKPFFLYLALTAPHAALVVPTQAYPAGKGLSGGLQWTGTPGAMVNTAGGTIDSWIHPDYAAATWDHDNNPATAEVAWSNASKRHATMVRRIDDAVADMIQLLKDLGVGDDTLIVFTSDNGPHNEGSYTGVTQDPTFFDSFGDMDGIKRDVLEGGLREPTIVRWPSAIPAGRVTPQPSQFHDWMATFADVAGVPAPAKCDGVSLRPALTGVGTQRASRIYTEYYYSGSTPGYAEFDVSHRGEARNHQQVVWIGNYKGVRRNFTTHAADFRIFDVRTDTHEAVNLSGQPGVPTQQEFKDAVMRVRRPAVDTTEAPLYTTIARPYDSEPVPPLSPAPVRTGVAWRAFEASYPWVPSFAGQAGAASGETAVPSVAVRTRDNEIGLEFKGYIKVPADGRYSFYLSTDTGAFLRLHEMQVLDCDKGYASGTEVSASVLLKAGLHPFTLGYRRGTSGTPSLAFSWSSDAIGKQSIPASAFYTDGPTPPTPPTALDDSATTTSGTAVEIPVLANDSDDGTPEALSIASFSQPGGGTVVRSGSGLRYTPRAGFNGIDSFGYEATDGGQAAAATVVVDVRAVSASLIWLPLDETSGTAAHDAGGRPLGALQNFPASPWVAGRIGGALACDGTDDRVVLSGQKGITGSAARTIVFWMNASATQTSGTRPTMVSWGTGVSGANGTRCDVNLDHTGGYRLRAEFNGGGMDFSTASLSDLRGAGWVHCAVVVPAGAQFKDVLGYINGVAATGAYVGGAANTTAVNTTALNDIGIGGMSDGTASRAFAGVVDDVRIYDRALSAAEVQALHAQSAPRVAADGWYFRHFAGLPSSADWLADGDGDGCPQLVEYARGTQPHIAGGPAIATVVDVLGGRALLRATFTRNPDVQGLVYAFEWSADLHSWTSGGDVIVDTAGRIEVRDAVECLPGAQRFVRVRVTLP